jgi:hypothetical protein
METIAGLFIVLFLFGILASLPIALGWMRRWGIAGKRDAGMIGGASFMGLLFISFFLPHPESRATETTESDRVAPTVVPRAKLDNIRVEHVMWEKGGLGNVMIATFRIDNDNAVRIKDVEVTCRHMTNNGTFIDSNTRTIHEIIEPRSHFYVRGMNMGLIHSQANSTHCKATDFVG